MDPEDPKDIWRGYYERKKAQRIEEASILWEQMRSAGVTEETVLALDFLLFGQSEENAVARAEQLSEHYKVEVNAAPENGYWYVNGTTRPHGLALSQEQHSGWVEFMADVTQSHACVFSTWSLDAPSLGVKFESEHVESAS